MYIVYTPKGAEPEHFDARSLLVSEVSIVSRTIDLKWPKIKEGIAEDDPEVLRGVVWVLKKRSQPSLRFGEFDPGIEEMVTRLDKDEVENYVTEAVGIAMQNPEVTGEQMADALQHLPPVAMDPAHAEAFIKELTAAPKDEATQAPQAEPAPPEPDAPPTSLVSTSSEPTTSDSSPTSSTSDPEMSTL
ncbi:hypothetical protein [Streptomyces sp. NBC_01794]|uniref:hypothetical protein n=1 Tax=Streptomyces sp. NBC_01794 TaxID=2975942 RepID=UPI0030857B56|nr:hypothetical protein OIE54_11975 [Streptomyces sp. NBC_01794]